MKTFKIENLYKSYQGNLILKDINVELEPAEFLVLVGPSGCGKSTLLNSIAGLEEIDKGNIFIGDKDVSELSPKDRDLAMVFQSYALYPNMSVRENIEFGLKIGKLSKEEINERVDKVSTMLHIKPLLDRKPSQLSGGQRQRVAIGRAISREPDIYLFDEPLSNLDAELRVKMRSEIKKLHMNVKKTMIYVTHDQVEAMTLADKIAVMKDGIIQQFGTPKAIYDNPNNLFTAGFIGSPSMNFIDATIQTEKGKHYFELANDSKESTKIFVDNPNLKDYENKEVIVGLRPEHIQNGFRDGGVANELLDIKVKVHFSELTGSDGYLYVNLNGKEVICRVSPSGLKAIGEETTLKIWAPRILFFDKQTELKI